jgi:hypothetical protein
MRTGRWTVVGAILVGVLILLGSGLLEVGGWRQFPWVGPDSVYLHRSWAPPAGLWRPDVSPFVEILAGVVSQYLVGVLFLVAVPRPVRRLADAYGGGAVRLARFLLIGILLAAALAAVGMLSAFYVHTFWLPIVLLFFFFLAAQGGAVALGFEIGRRMLTRAGWGGGSPLISLALGSSLIFAGTRIPYVGPLVLGLVWLTGAGAALATRLGSGTSWSLAPLVEDRSI